MNLKNIDWEAVEKELERRADAPSIIVEGVPLRPHLYKNTELLIDSIEADIIRIHNGKHPRELAENINKILEGENGR